MNAGYYYTKANQAKWETQTKFDLRCDGASIYEMEQPARKVGSDKADVVVTRLAVAGRRLMNEEM